MPRRGRAKFGVEPHQHGPAVIVPGLAAMVGRVVGETGIPVLAAPLDPGERARQRGQGDAAHMLQGSRIEDFDRARHRHGWIVGGGADELRAVDHTAVHMRIERARAFPLGHALAGLLVVFPDAVVGHRVEEAGVGGDALPRFLGGPARDRLGRAEFGHGRRPRSRHLLRTAGRGGDHCRGGGEQEKLAHQNLADTPA